MLIKKIYISFLFIISVFFNTAFGDYENNTGTINSSTQSIKELKSGLLELTKDQNDLNLEFFVLNQNQKLKEFFNEDLTKDEINEIKIIIDKYLENKKELDIKIKIKATQFLNTENERNGLLNEKKEFYKKLIPYIKKEQLQFYIEYINQDVKILKEKGELSEKLIINNEIITNKVGVIEEKIKEHILYLDEKFNTLINEIIDQKINTLINNEKFIKLDLNSKQLVITKILIRVQITISTLEKKLDKTDALNKKLEIYNKVYIKLNEIKNNLGN